jgi:peroxiredoxin Q/BCP
MLPELRARNAEVVGVSSDGFDRQCDFARSLALEFPLVADPDGAIARPYGAHRALLNLDRRVTYVIDPEGLVAAAFHHELSIGRHETDVRDFLARVAGSPPTPAATSAPPPVSNG